MGGQGIRTIMYQHELRLKKSILRPPTLGLFISLPPSAGRTNGMTNLFSWFLTSEWAVPVELAFDSWQKCHLGYSAIAGIDSDKGGMMSTEGTGKLSFGRS